jgi:competence protein ComGC
VALIIIVLLICGAILILLFHDNLFKNNDALYNHIGAYIHDESTTNS